MFWIISILFLLVACLFMVMPLWQQFRTNSAAGQQSRTDVNLSIFQHRQQELELDLANGSLDQEQFDALLLELQKTLLVDTENSSTANTETKKLTKAKTRDKADFISRAVPLLLLLLIPIVAYGLYQQWGSLEEIELMELYDRTVNNANDQEETRNLIISLGEVVQLDEENQWAWYFLGRNFSNIGMFPEAEIAFQRASDLMPEGPDKAATLGLYAQIKYVTSGGELTDEVLRIVAEARAINPSEFASLQLLSLDAETKGDFQAAIGYWRLMIQVNPNSQMAQELRTSIAAAQAMLAGQDGSNEGAGPRVEVNVQLASGLSLPPDMRVFVSARNAEREGMPPLAATDLTVRDLPASVTLDNSLAVGPFNLASANTIYVTATVSASGSATVQSGDYRVVSQNFAPAGQHTIIDLTISEAVP